MGGSLYTWLMKRVTGGPLDAFDAHCLASTIAARCEEPQGTLAARLGLAEEDLKAILGRYFGGADLTGFCATSDRPEDIPIEEDDLRTLLLDHRARGDAIEEWMAALVAHACRRSDHLWQDLGFSSRKDVTTLLQRHFPGLALLNVKDMKWKKFLYKQLCEREDIRICKSPNCEDCSDHDRCFGAEDGDAFPDRG
ncbi:MAG: nitrogen fixation protein NifQ [Magnetospirillum sp. WYHS-4]